MYVSFLFQLLPLPLFILLLVYFSFLQIFSLLIHHFPSSLRCCLIKSFFLTCFPLFYISFLSFLPHSAFCYYFLPVTFLLPSSCFSWLFLCFFHIIVHMLPVFLLHYFPSFVSLLSSSSFSKSVSTYIDLDR